MTSHNCSRSLRCMLACIGALASTTRPQSLHMSLLIVMCGVSAARGTFARLRAPCVASMSSGPAAGGAGPVRSYPSEPRVGVGVVVLRPAPPPATHGPEVLLIRRAKEPAKGMWCFAGGSLELGETLEACAVREVLEETGVRLRAEAPPGDEVFSDSLCWPTPFAAADSITPDRDGRLAYHYAIINIAAVPEDPGQVPEARDDVDDARWIPVAELRRMPNLVEKCARVAEEAVRRFSLEAD